MSWGLCQRRRSVGISCWLVAWKRMAAKRGRALWQKLGMRVAWFGLDKIEGAEKSSEKVEERKREKDTRMLLGRLS